MCGGRVLQNARPGFGQARAKPPSNRDVVTLLRPLKRAHIVGAGR